MAISNDQIYETLLDIKQDIGGLVAKTEEHRLQFVKHVADDAAMAADLSTVKLQLADWRGSQRGSAKVWGVVAAGAGAVGGGMVALAKLFFSSHN